MQSNETETASGAAVSESDGAVAALERELAFLVRWLEAVQRRRSYLLERAHYLLLLLLIEQGPQGVGQVAEQLRLDASTVTRQVDVMVSRQLVEKIANPEDRRGSLVRATERGRSEMEAMRRQRESRVTHLVANWPGDRRQQLAELLGDLNLSLCQVLDEG